ncbi:MAG: hypothetical protein JKY95_03315 [Planctomycetaceae bacterium]|nr:hypothetical protein [Planctomycetaceae bacterium]
MKIASTKHTAINNSRLGYSLIEQVAVISLMGTVMSIVVSILFYCMKTDRSFSNQARQMQVVNMLSEDLRSDIHTHDWNNIRIDPDQSLHLSDAKESTSVTYRWKGHQLLREQQTGQTEKPQRESYWFPEGSKLQWLQDETSQTVALQIEQPISGTMPSQTGQPPLRKLVIKAQAGRFIEVAQGASK